MVSKILYLLLDSCVLCATISLVPSFYNIFCHFHGFEIVCGHLRFCCVWSHDHLLICSFEQLTCTVLMSFCLVLMFRFVFSTLYLNLNVWHISCSINKKIELNQTECSFIHLVLQLLDKFFLNLVTVVCRMLRGGNTRFRQLLPDSESDSTDTDVESVTEKNKFVVNLCSFHLPYVRFHFNCFLILRVTLKEGVDFKPSKTQNPFSCPSPEEAKTLVSSSVTSNNHPQLSLPRNTWKAGSLNL